MQQPLRGRWSSRPKTSLGLYLHVPFCTSKCTYCDFYSFAAPETRMDEYTDALCRTIAAWGARCVDTCVDTIYFGGGTPSLLGGAQLAHILSAAYAAFTVKQGAEITTECNPDSMDAALLDTLRGAGVNRLSVGVQSAHEDELWLLGRRHTFAQAREAIKLAQACGFDNISLDLMYGLPGQTVDKLLQSARGLIALNPAHLSCYALALEESTPLWRANPTLPDEDAQADAYLALCALLASHGYGHDEISNWAKPGLRARHNARYWDLSAYLGLGPSAHSLFGGKRFAYGRSLDDFIAGVPPEPEEAMAGFSPADEFLMLALRTADGVHPESFEARFGVSFAPYAHCLQKFAPHGLTAFEDGSWRLTEQGFLLSNSILTDVLSVE